MMDATAAMRIIALSQGLHPISVNISFAFLDDAESRPSDD
jgi:hypothetical protein